MITDFVFDIDILYSSISFIVFFKAFSIVHKNVFVILFTVVFGIISHNSSLKTRSFLKYFSELSVVYQAIIATIF